MKHTVFDTIVTLTLMFALLFTGLLVVGGCASQGTGPNAQQQQFQQSVAFWTAEVTALRKAVETLPPGSQRDKALKDLQTAEFWIAFFTPLVNPPVPATQPVK